MSDRTPEEFISSVAHYTSKFQNILQEIAANALPGGATVAGMTLYAMYSPTEIAQASWAGNEIGMPEDQAVVLFVVLSAMAYKPQRSTWQKVFNKQSTMELNHVSMVNFATEIVGEPDSNFAPKFAERYAQLLSKDSNRI